MEIYSMATVVNTVLCIWKIPIMAFFTDLEQKISQFLWKLRRPWIVKAVLRKKNGTGGTSFPDFRLY